MDKLALYDSINQSNMPRGEKSALRRLFDTAIDVHRSVKPSTKQVHNAMSAFRAGSESIATGIALGAVRALRKDGLDMSGVPIDGAVGLLMLTGSALWAHSELAPDARTIGGNSLCVFSERMTEAFIKEKRAAPKPTATHAGDPIVAASENL